MFQLLKFPNFLFYLLKIRNTSNSAISKRLLRRLSKMFINVVAHICNNDIFLKCVHMFLFVFTSFGIFKSINNGSLGSQNPEIVEMLGFGVMGDSGTTRGFGCQVWVWGLWRGHGVGGRGGRGGGGRRKRRREEEEIEQPHLEGWGMTNKSKKSNIFLPPIEPLYSPRHGWPRHDLLTHPPRRRPCQ